MGYVVGGKQPYKHLYFLYGDLFLASWYYADGIGTDAHIQMFADVRWVGFLPPWVMPEVNNGTERFNKCKQLFEYQHLLLLRDIWVLKF
jgi:hypothetical protein